ncbi:hypothetical protein Fcan01_02901 [Folsomia candida]|uniref:Uncharacterized protein n=1 Tax=Folsomia candida TaxID=158441 RepID=A0A226F2I9_FOLCA|nr:hypothetical protein Fcan01_02901 [Folsomia candida]
MSFCAVDGFAYPHHADISERVRFEKRKQCDVNVIRTFSPSFALLGFALGVVLGDSEAKGDQTTGRRQGQDLDISPVQSPLSPFFPLQTDDKGHFNNKKLEKV